MKISVFSSVGGGPMQRLVDRLRAGGRDAELVSRFSPLRWRQLSRGRGGRWRARFEAMIRTPILALRHAITTDSVQVPTTNPFFLPVFLVATKAIHGRVVVPLIYDLYPDAVEAIGQTRPDSLLSRIGVGLNRFLFRHADGMVFIGERMGAHARGRYGEPVQSAVLPTGAVAAELDITVEDQFEGKLVVSYVGNMGHVHDWETLRDGLAQLCRAEADDIVVIIAASGQGVELLKKDLGDTSGQIRFIEPLEDDEWRALQARTDIALVSLKEAARHTSVPSKAFSAMAAGSAIVAVAPRDSDLADVVIDNECGVVVAPGNSLQLLDALLGLARDREALSTLQARARAAALERYDIDRLAARWVELVDEVAAHRRPGIGYALCKRLFDASVAGIALVALSPVLLGAAAAVRVSMGAPVLFRQQRPGHFGQPFNLYKFRSMRDARPGEEGPEHDAARLTRTGRFIRATSIDELPALLNVLAGEMSLVGPRPLLMRYLERYDDRQARRHDVVPGVTGLAQVRGRNAISWEEKFEYDLEYIDNRSLALDLRILIETALAVVTRRDISKAGHATMPEFMGSRVNVVGE